MSGGNSIAIYIYSHSDILERMGEKLCHHEPISGVFSAALGNYGYLVRSPDLEEINEMVKYIQATAS